MKKKEKKLINIKLKDLIKKTERKSEKKKEIIILGRNEIR